MNNRPAMRGAQIAIAQALLIAASLFVFLQGWRRDIRVPLYFSGDTPFYLMQSKSTIDNGWWWFNPLIGAPFGYDALAFPANSSVDQAIVWTISWFVPHALTLVNLAWASMVVLSGLAATWCMRHLGATTISSIVAGTLFAVSPFVFYRNIAHFGLVIYLVPFVSTAALLLAAGRLPDRWYSASSVFLLLGCALLGFNYVYYAFFGSFFVAAAAIVGSLTHRNLRILAAGGIVLAVIASCTLLNLAPSLYAWNRDGRPIIVHEKTPAESELFGLKIRQLVSPVLRHSFPPFRGWTEKEGEARFPLETENRASRLGLVGTIGFLGLLGLLLVPGDASQHARGKTLLGASQLTIAAVLLATVGGFGSLFSLLVSPEIRAYNRIAPFIAFFSLTAVALTLDMLLKTRGRRIVGGAIVLALGLADQRAAATDLNAEYASIAAELAPLEVFVRDLESRLPDQAMVLQLPFRTFLNESDTTRMKRYDHLKLYAVSHGIRWSYPALSNEQLRWQQAAAGLDPRQLPYQLVAEGFAAIVIDRYGYDDNGAAVSMAIRADLAGDSTLAQTGRYVAFDIRSLSGTPSASASPLSTLSTPATLKMTACNGQPTIGIDKVGSSSGTPLAGSVIHLPRSKDLRVEGWAVDHTREVLAAAVDIVVDRTPFTSVYGIDRDDVAAHYGRAAYRSSGFMGEIPADSLAAGPHTLTVRVVSSARECYYESPGIAIVMD